MIALLLDSGVIQSGDGAELGAALVTLVTACVGLPWAFAVAWSFFRSFIEGDGDDS